MAPFFGENIYLTVEENALPAAEKKKRERKHIHTYMGRAVMAVQIVKRKWRAAFSRPGTVITIINNCD